MSHVPDFRNLYPRSLIPMGQRDRDHFVKEVEMDKGTLDKATHWLTAYLWREDGDQIGWDVIVYPADAKGSFVQYEPYFDYKSYVTYAKAKKLMNIVEFNMFHDTFTRADFLIEIVRFSELAPDPQ